MIFPETFIIMRPFCIEIITEVLLGHLTLLYLRFFFPFLTCPFQLHHMPGGAQIYLAYFGLNFH